MTEERLKQGNEITTEINELECFLIAFNDKCGANVIKAKYVKWRDEFSGNQMYDKILDLRKYTELSNMIIDSISNHIKELKKQLKEL
ncbi:hypothetical protein H8S37_04060 [Mediterraneibacter sp. NSJ-55]|uniref:Uncharacterized protein n=1 Tax=Mediterraneibacter hominis TaxID=2763054 RepID=A0A923LG49_9FIRM|nr:hypothetical protein [Mediterraneibacter hominis]MBC5688108.1 hypothetical protein [Mediterraneibacter hominis]